MLKLLCMGLTALVGLAGCSKSATPPPNPYAALLIAGPWQPYSDYAVATPTGGSPSTSFGGLSAPGTTVDYRADGTLLIKYVSPYPSELGTYTLAGAALTTTVSGRPPYTRTIRVLTANRLELDSDSELAGYRYVGTSTLVR